MQLLRKLKEKLVNENIKIDWSRKYFDKVYLK